MFYDLGWLYAGASLVFFIVGQSSDGAILAAFSLACFAIHCYRSRKKSADMEQKKC